MNAYRETEGVATHETSRLIASDKVEGTAVYGTNGERLGKVQNFMVDKRSGQVEYAVLGFGGLFGMGEDHYPLPWNTLTYDKAKSGYVVSLTRDQLEKAPRYRTGEEPPYDADYDRRLIDYYGITSTY